MSKSTLVAPARKPVKPAKPHKDFPLTPHPNGLWCKKVRGKLHYFGPWNDPDKALADWLEKKDDILGGRTPRPGGKGQLRLHELVNLFLSFKRQLVDNRELTEGTWRDYRRVGEKMSEVFGRNRAVADLRPDDFERLRASVAKRAGTESGYGPVALCDFITRCRVIFKYAADNDLIDRPVRYGQAFKRPSKTVLRKLRNERGPKMFTATELRTIIDAADQPLKAMILLGCNAGFGNGDCGRLPQAAVDLKGGWINFPRPKTHVGRRVPLWPETVKAIKESLAERPTPKSEADADLVFITKYGAGWHKADGSDNPVSKAMRKLLDSVGIERNGVNFYTLRHCFQTIGQQARDKDAVKAIMGHVEDSGDMSAHYSEEGPSDDRLRAVVNHVRKWLFPPKAKGGKKKAK